MRQRLESRISHHRRGHGDNRRVTRLSGHRLGYGVKHRHAVYRLPMLARRDAGHDARAILDRFKREGRRLSPGDALDEDASTRMYKDCHCVLSLYAPLPLLVSAEIAALSASTT